jgi:hypothetical protein
MDGNERRDHRRGSGKLGDVAMKTNRSIGLMLTAALATAGVGCVPGPAPLGRTNFDQSASDAMPTPPPGAQYTILCMTFAGPSHTVDADRARDELKKAKKLDKWYVVNYGEKSILYYGFYRCNDPRDISDAQEGQRAVDDQNQIRALADSQNHRIFSAALLQPIDSPDPEENPEWDLLKSPGYWSLEIGVFKNTPDRKERAVAAVKEFRKNNVDAYYFHGPSISSVCIGSWPQNSVREYAAEHQMTDPNETVVVADNGLPSGVVLPGNTRLLKPTVEIEDPTLIQALQTYHEHDVNGGTKEYTITDGPDKGKKIDEQPLLVRIPNRPDSPGAVINDPALAHNDYTSNVPVPAGPTKQDPLHDSTSEALHSIYDK